MEPLFFSSKDNDMNTDHSLFKFLIFESESFRRMPNKNGFF